MLLINIFQWPATTVRTNTQVLSMAYKSLWALTPGYNLSLILEHSPCSLLTEHWYPCCSGQLQSKLCLRAFSLTLPSAWNPFLSYMQGFLHHCLQAGRVSSWEVFPGHLSLSRPLLTFSSKYSSLFDILLYIYGSLTLCFSPCDWCKFFEGGDFAFPFVF